MTEPVHDVEVLEKLRTIFDPEIPNVNIVELGLVYDVRVEAGNDVKVTMTLTARGCPMSQQIGDSVRRVVGELQGVSNVDVQIVWDPAWNPSMMDDEAKRKLGIA
ncbi:MAG: metal-sulfur cluster assembly factor [Acidobacteriota bacterium]